MKHPNSNSPVTIAVLQTAFIGDIALTLPFIVSLKNTFRDSYIIFITTPAGAELCKEFDTIDKVFVFDKRKSHKTFAALQNFAREISEKNIDYIFVPHKSFRSALLVFLIRFFSQKKIITIGYTDNAFSLLLTKRVQPPKAAHEIVKLHSLLKPFVGENYIHSSKEHNYSVYFPEKQVIEDQFSGITIAIAPGSVWKTKKWSENNFAEAAIKLKEKGHTVILIGGNEDAELCERIARQSNSVSFAGKHTLSETVRILSHCALLISNDSAPAHLAYLAHCPVIMIYGPTVPEFGFYPLDPRSKVLQNNDLKCRPCHHHGLNRCPLGTHECMTSILPITVMEHAEETLLNHSA